ncbi:MAG: ATP-binding cassette domain-containing protein [Gemmatimonadota bacterium]
MSQPAGPVPPPGDSRDASVEARELTRKFGNFTAVDSVSFAVRPGEIFGFLGPNGAGKTTTIRMLTGLLPPTSGEASVAGWDVATQGDRVRRSIGYMSQLFSLYLDLEVIENIELFAGLYDVLPERVDERADWVLETAELTDRRNAPTGTLPLGFKQRLALGCAVLHEPPVLFLDEPTSGVDPAARRRFWDLIDDLSEGGTTVLVSTHYMEEAEYCHRLALMNRGRLIALDRPAALREELPGSILEIEIEGDPLRALQALEDLPAVEDIGMFGRALRVRAPDSESAREAIAERLASKEIALRSVETVPAELEDVFVALVQREGGAAVG